MNIFNLSEEERNSLVGQIVDEVEKDWKTPQYFQSGPTLRAVNSICNIILDDNDPEETV